MCTLNCAHIYVHSPVRLLSYICVLSISCTFLYNQTSYDVIVFQTLFQLSVRRVKCCCCCYTEPQGACTNSLCEVMLIQNVLLKRCSVIYL